MGLFSLERSRFWEYLIEVYKYLKGGARKTSFFLVVHSSRTRDNGYVLEHRSLSLNIRKKKKIIMWGWPSAGTDCPERLRSVLLGDLWKLPGHGPHQPTLGVLAWVTGVNYMTSRVSVQAQPSFDSKNLFLTSWKGRVKIKSETHEEDVAIRSHAGIFKICNNYFIFSCVQNVRVKNFHGKVPEAWEWWHTE